MPVGHGDLARRQRSISFEADGSR